MSYNIEIDYEVAGALVRQSLIDSLECIDPVYDSQLFDAINKTIAYYSVPRTWCGGIYDCDEYDDEISSSDLQISFSGFDETNFSYSINDDTTAQSLTLEALTKELDNLRVRFDQYSMTQEEPYFVDVAFRKM